MKTLLTTIILSGSLAMPHNPSLSPPVLGIPLTAPVPEPVVAIPIIPAAIGVGIGFGILGWGAIKAINGILRIREHQLTNNVPEVGFTVPLESEDYPE